MTKLLLKTLLVVAIAVTALSVTSTTNAQDAQGGAYYAAPWLGFYGYQHLNNISNQPVLPYFSLYPPVYYSDVVPRPYGYSPFALPPGIAPVEKVPAKVEAQEVVNPFYRPEAADQQADGKTASTGQLIINPYVVDSAHVDPRLVNASDAQ